MPRKVEVTWRLTIDGRDAAVNELTYPELAQIGNSPEIQWFQTLREAVHLEAQKRIAQRSA